MKNHEKKPIIIFKDNFTQLRKAELSRRKNILKKFKNAAVKVAKQTQSKKALNLLAMLTNGVISKPRSNGFVPLERIKNPFFAIVPILQEDLANPASLSWSKILMDNSLAQTIKNRLLVLKDIGFSTTYLGAIFLHELLHVQKGKETTRPQTKSEFHKEELECYEFEIGLLRKVGGTKYAALMKKMFEKCPASATSFCEEIRSYRHELDTIFGETLTPREKRPRMMLLRLDYILRSSRRLAKNSEEQQQLKIRYIEHLYSQYSK